MKEIMVDGHWPLSLIEGQGGHFAYMETEASKWNEACFAHIISGLPEGLTVAEYFGGVGIFATIVQNRLCPSMHYVSDLDRDCVRQLHSAFASDKIQVARADARRAMGTIDADIVILDFPTMNARFLARDWPIARVLRRKPKYVIWSDTALRRIGWFRHLYTSFFGQLVFGYDDYIRCYNKHMWRTYGYTITRVTRHMYAYLLAQPLPVIATPEVTTITVHGVHRAMK
jgi:hypothetical protein